VLAISDLRHVYGRGSAAHVAIDGISLRVAAGELVAIVGTSGCGKTTLLRCIAGLQRPAHGTIAVNGAVVHGVPEGLAVVFQDYSRSLYPWLSVRDNVALPLVRTHHTGTCAGISRCGRSRRWGWPTRRTVTRGSCRAGLPTGLAAGAAGQSRATPP
jgi:ABC-type nitrate/sulfonate/bicarbonate transport system ATPase subunit